MFTWVVTKDEFKSLLLGGGVVEIVKFTKWCEQWRPVNCWQGLPTAYHATVEKWKCFVVDKS